MDLEKNAPESIFHFYNIHPIVKPSSFEVAPQELDIIKSLNSPHTIDRENQYSQTIEQKFENISDWQEFFLHKSFCIPKKIQIKTGMSKNTFQLFYSGF